MGRLHTVPVISIVDDDESVRTAMLASCDRSGFTAHTFASAEEFLRSKHIDETSCLIADVQMPGINGIELQSLVHAQGRRTPIVFITAFPEERIRVRATRAGAIGYGEGMALHGADALVVDVSQTPGVVILEYEVQGNAVGSGKLYENRFVSVVTIEDRKIVGWPTTWTRWRRCPHLPSGLNPALGAYAGR